MTHTIPAVVPAVVDRALRRLVVPFITALVMVVATEDASAQNVERTGKEVVEASCFACHGSGANGAPNIGDKQAWAKRTAQGLTSLTASALRGIRQMPPHGGNTNLTDTEIERAITYMVNQSGGNWIEPISRTARSPERTGGRCTEDRRPGRLDTARQAGARRRGSFRDQRPRWHASARRTSRPHRCRNAKRDHLYVQ